MSVSCSCHTAKGQAALLQYLAQYPNLPKVCAYGAWVGRLSIWTSPSSHHARPLDGCTVHANPLPTRCTQPMPTPASPPQAVPCCRSPQKKSLFTWPQTWPRAHFTTVALVLSTKGIPIPPFPGRPRETRGREELTSRAPSCQCGSGCPPERCAPSRPPPGVTAPRASRTAPALHRAPQAAPACEQGVGWAGEWVGRWGLR